MRTRERWHSWRPEEGDILYGWSYRQFVHLSYRHWVHLMWVLRVEPEPFEEQCTLLTTKPTLEPDGWLFVFY